MARAQRENDHFIAVGDEEETRQGLWVLYRGYWLKPQTAESVTLVEAQFKPRPDDLFLAETRFSEHHLSYPFYLGCSEMH
jgi:hypothetical protein